MSLLERYQRTERLAEAISLIDLLAVQPPALAQARALLAGLLKDERKDHCAHIKEYRAELLARLKAMAAEGSA